MLGTVTITGWAFSFSEAKDTMALRFNDQADVFASDGSLAICDHRGNLDVIEVIKSGSTGYLPKPVSMSFTDAPGLKFDYVEFNAETLWSIHISLLLRSVLLFATVGFFLILYRKSIRRERTGPATIAT